MKRLLMYGTIISLIFFLSPSSYTAEVDIKMLGQRMKNALGTISIGVKNDDLLKIMKRKSDLELLRRAVDSSERNSEIIFSSKIEYSKPFLTSLMYDTEAFETFVGFYKKGPIPLSTYSNVLDASWDLEMKARVVKTSNTDRVRVKINTIDEQGKEIHYCIVWYVPFLKDDEQHKTRFDQLSTPTTDFIPAGKWKIWTEKDAKMGPKIPFNCGDDGRNGREIDIFSPK